MVYFFHDISEEIRKAKELYSVYSGEIMHDEKCSFLLEELKTAIEETRKFMKELGVIDICSACADEKAGGCCHYGIETCYTDMILLMNLLLGVKIPGKRSLEKNCLFVSEYGCQLKARFKTCIHHLCPKITGSIDEYDLFRLRATNSHEIKVCNQSESAIRDLIRKA